MLLPSEKVTITFSLELQYNENSCIKRIVLIVHERNHFVFCV